MTSPLFEDNEFEWPTGAYPAVTVKEPDMTRIIRIAESKKAGLKLWAEVQRELQRVR